MQRPSSRSTTRWLEAVRSPTVQADVVQIIKTASRRSPPG